MLVTCILSSIKTLYFSELNASFSCWSNQFPSFLSFWQTACCYYYNDCLDKSFQVVVENYLYVLYTHKYTIIYLYTLLLQKYEEQDVVPFGLCDPLFGSTSSRTMSRAMPLYVSNTGKGLKFLSASIVQVQQQSMMSVVTPIWSFNLPHQRALYYIDKVDFILGIWLLCTYLLSNILVLLTTT